MEPDATKASRRSVIRATGTTRPASSDANSDNSVSVNLSNQKRRWRSSTIVSRGAYRQLEHKPARRACRLVRTRGLPQPRQYTVVVADTYFRTVSQYQAPVGRYAAARRFLNADIARPGCSWRFPIQIPNCDQASMSSSFFTFGNSAQLWMNAATSAGLLVSS